MLTVELQGGLGNQLFQIFATIAAAFDNRIQFVLPTHKRDTHSAGGASRPTYWDNLFVPLQNFLSPVPFKGPTYIERGFHHTPLPALISRQHVRLLGYFQSPKYFERHYDKISKLLRLEAQRSDVYLESKCLHKEWKDQTLISMHFRIGDYIATAHRDAHPIQNYEYYEKALHHILSVIPSTNSQPKVLYFCEQNDEDVVEHIVNRLRETYDAVAFERVSYDVPDWKQMLMMSCCNHHIIANSSFSWWGAYLNPCTTKIVCYPSKWFGPALPNHDTRDLFPEEWVKT